jgi:hypothetical protein
MRQSSVRFYHAAGLASAIPAFDRAPPRHRGGNSKIGSPQGAFPFDITLHENNIAWANGVCLI